MEDQKPRKPLHRRIVDTWEAIARCKVRGEVSQYLIERAHLDTLLEKWVKEQKEHDAVAALAANQTELNF